MYPVELFVARDVAYRARQGGGTINNIGEINELALGAVALFDENNNIILAGTNSADLKNVSQFRIAINDSNGVRLSSPIDRSAYNATKQGFVAEAKQVVVVGENAAGNGSMNLPTLISGQVAELVITNRSSADYRVNQSKRYYADVTNSSTASTVVAALITAINNDPDSIVVATAQGANVGIILEAKEFVTTFDVGVTEIIESANIWKDGTSNSVVWEPGRGNVRQLKELQEESDILLGKSAFAGQQQYWWTRQDEVTASGITGFEMFIFQDASESRVAGKIQSVATKDTVLALPTGTAPTTGIVDFITGIFDVVLTGTETSSGSATDADN